VFENSTLSTTRITVSSALIELFGVFLIQIVVKKKKKKTLQEESSEEGILKGLP
jgi:hypothetical protein